MTRTDMTAGMLAEEEAERKLASTIAMDRVGEALEIAEAIRWLLSPAASFISGALVDASGGGLHQSASVRMKEVRMWGG
jgi:NAD(P)-dependent dehydrogenase (short-subunit alcohol dehydrogenase family)